MIEVAERDGRFTFTISHLTSSLKWQSPGKISIPDLLQKLRSLDIHSVMVEGGASVIGSFLAEAPVTREDGGLDYMVDTLIVTVAPRFVGDDGVGYGIGLSADKVWSPIILKGLRTDPYRGSSGHVDPSIAAYTDGGDR